MNDRTPLGPGIERALDAGAERLAELLRDQPAPNDERAVTVEEIVRVHRYECTMRGHTWEIIATLSGGPTRIVCRHCGESHPVGRDA